MNMGIGLRLALLVVALLLVSCGGDDAHCQATDIPSDGRFVGNIRIDGADWRVQLHELPPHCDGMTSEWLGVRNVSFRPGMSPLRYHRMALHEVGHALGMHEHLDDADAVMHAATRADNITDADRAYCRDEGICVASVAPPVANDVAFASVATADACSAWSAFTKPEFRPVFTPATKDDR